MGVEQGPTFGAHGCPFAGWMGGWIGRPNGHPCAPNAGPWCIRTSKIKMIQD